MGLISPCVGSFPVTRSSSSVAKFVEPSLDPIINGEVSSEDAIAEIQERMNHPDANPRWAIPWMYALWTLGQFGQAYEVANRFHSTLQNDCDFLLMFGMVARRIPVREEEAEASFLAAIRLDRKRADNYYNLGNLYLDQERYHQAQAQYLQALRCNPLGALIWLNLGLAARADEHHSLALSAISKSLQLDPSNSRAWCNYGLTLHQMERFDAATTAYVHALSLDPDSGDVLVNLALALNARNRHPEALKYLESASSLSLNVDAGDALFNLALTNLLLGNFQEGWELYECRFNTRQFFDYKKIPERGWVRTDQQLRQLANQGASIVVWSEQGFGDAIQFSRYLNLLNAMGLKPILRTRPKLVRLFQEWLNPAFTVLDDEQNELADERRPHTSMMSLPHLFKTGLHSVPSSTPYLHPPGPPPEALLVQEPPGGLAIGVVWGGNPDNKMMYKRKSLPLSLLIEPLLPALREDLMALHALQVGVDSDALQPYEEHPNVINWNGRLGDFADTAHVVRQLDLVITIDTAVAHLAGALGVKTWLLLPFDADFRWMRGCDHSPWYPGMRLFRQHRFGDWLSITTDVMDALGRIYGLQLKALQ